METTGMTRPTTGPTRRRVLLADLTLLLVTVSWGSTFVVVQDAIRELSVPSFMAVRFTLASLVLSLIVALLRLKVDRRVIRDGAILGSFLFWAYWLQTLGLLTTTPSRAGFLTGMSVAVVPVLSAFLLRRPPSRAAIVGVTLAVAGLFLLMDPAGGRWAIGDSQVAVCALFVAGHILLTGRYAPRHHPMTLAAVSIAAVALWSWGAYLVAAPSGERISHPVWNAIIVTALFATVFAFWAQTAMQRITSPTRTALIFTGEPVFAALFDWWWNGRLLPVSGYLGGALILAGMVAAELSAHPERE
jgi:drug/metabolite transporter (DMT)-like permease